MAEARPCPFLRLLHQAPMDWVAMNVTKLFRRLLRIPDIEIVVARLPEGTLRSSLGNGELEGLNRSIKVDAFGLIDQEVHMLGHDDVSDHNELVSPADCLEC